MSVTSVRVKSVGLSGRTSGTEAASAVSSYRVRYDAVVDSLADDPFVVKEYFRNTSSLPFMGRPYAVGNGSDPTAVCRELEVERTEKSFQFAVNAVFEPQDGTSRDDPTGVTESGEETKDPTQFRDEIEVSYSPLSVPVEEAIFRGFSIAGINNFFPNPGDPCPVMNTAHQKFEPGVETELYITTIRVTKYRAGFDSFLYPLFAMGAVNSQAFSIFKPAYNFNYFVPPLAGKLRPVPAQFGILNNIKYFRIVQEIHIHPIDWRHHLANLGTQSMARPGLENPDTGDTYVTADFDAKGFDIVQNKDAADYPLAGPLPLTIFGQRYKDPTQPPIWLIYSSSPEVPLNGIQW